MDIDPKYYAKQTQQFLKANKLDILEWQVSQLIRTQQRSFTVTEEKTKVNGSGSEIIYFIIYLLNSLCLCTDTKFKKLF